MILSAVTHTRQSLKINEHSIFMLMNMIWWHTHIQNSKTNSWNSLSSLWFSLPISVDSSVSLAGLVANWWQNNSIQKHFSSGYIVRLVQRRALCVPWLLQLYTHRLLIFCNISKAYSSHMSPLYLWTLVKQCTTKYEFKVAYKNCYSYSM